MHHHRCCLHNLKAIRAVCCIIVLTGVIWMMKEQFISIVISTLLKGKRSSSVSGKCPFRSMLLFPWFNINLILLLIKNIYILILFIANVLFFWLPVCIYGLLWNSFHFHWIGTFTWFKTVSLYLCARVSKVNEILYVLCIFRFICTFVLQCFPHSRIFIHMQTSMCVSLFRHHTIPMMTVFVWVAHWLFFFQFVVSF